MPAKVEVSALKRSLVRIDAPRFGLELCGKMKGRWTIEDVAREARVSVSTVKARRRGESELVDRFTAEQLCRVLDIDLAQFEYTGGEVDHRDVDRFTVRCMRATSGSAGRRSQDFRAMVEGRLQSYGISINSFMARINGGKARDVLQDD